MEKKQTVVASDALTKDQIDVYKRQGKNRSRQYFIWNCPVTAPQISSVKKPEQNHFFFIPAIM